MKHSKSKLFVAFLLIVLMLGLVPITAYAASPTDLVIGNSYTLSSGESLNDDLFVVGGSVSLQNGSTVNGNVIVIGSSLDAAGKINGDLVVLGGTLKLANTFIMNGNLSTGGAAVTRAPGAQINGEIYTERNVPQIFTLPGGIRLNNLGINATPMLDVAGFFLRLFIWVLLAMVVAMFIPTQLTRTSQTALSEPVASGGIGCLTIIVGPIVIVLLAITICLIPASLLAAFLLVIAWAFGLVALGLEVGKRVSTMFNQKWHPAITTGVGMLLLMVVLNGLEAILPCVGWIPKALVGLLGLGAVLLTQFGMKSYPSIPVLSPQSPVDVLPPQAPMEDLPPETPPDNI
jgi:hypothetical protein